MSNKTHKFTVELQEYEIALIQDGLNLLIKNCGRMWERQENGQYNYSANRKSRQIDFVKNSLVRQIKEQTIVPIDDI